MMFWMRLVALFFSICLSSCEKRVINHGYMPGDVDFKAIKIGDSEPDVRRLLGAPTIKSSVKSEDGSFSWFYVLKKTEKRSFLEPKILDQRVYIVSFDKGGEVSSVRISTYAKAVEAVKDNTTKTSVKSGSIVEEAFGGVGRYIKRYEKKEKE